MAKNEFSISSHMSSGCACWGGVVSSFQNLGWWLDQLITKVVAAVSLFFRTLAFNCSACVLISFQNLGLRLHTQVNRLTSLPPAAPKRRSKKKDHQQLQKRKTPLEELADEMRRRAEPCAVEAAAPARDAAAPNGSNQDVLTSPPLEAKLSGGKLKSAPTRRRADAASPVKRGSRGGRASLPKEILKANVEILDKGHIFFPGPHKEWFKKLKDIPHQISLLIGGISEPDSEHDPGGSAAEDPERDRLRERVREYVWLRYLRSLLPLSSESRGEQRQEVLTIFFGLTEAHQQALIKRYRPEVKEWDGTIPEGLWQDPGLGALIDQAVQALIPRDEP